MDEITVLNVTAVDWKINFAYFLSILLVSTMIVVMMQRYRWKYESWKKLRSPNVDFKTDTDVAHHSIMIHNLPTNVPPELLEKRISSVLREVFNKQYSEDVPFVQARVIGNYDETYDCCVRLKRNIEKLQRVSNKNAAYRDEGSEQRVTKKVSSWLKC